jgi:hypothetical protein
MTGDRRIALVNIGSVVDNPLQALVPILEAVFEAEIGTTEPLPLPRLAYNASRDQHLSSRLLDDWPRGSRRTGIVSWESLAWICTCRV